MILRDIDSTWKFPESESSRSRGAQVVIMRRSRVLVYPAGPNEPYTVLQYQAAVASAVKTNCHVL